MKHLHKVKAWHLGVLNLLGVLASFFYGVTGGSGGETTEGVFMGIYLTGVISIVLCLVFVLAGIFTKSVTWGSVIIVIGIMLVSYLETTIYTP